MDHIESGIGRSWESLEEELDALRDNPRARALLRDLETQDPERVDLLLTDLETQAGMEGLL
jgi:hypothetical protein